MPYVSESKGKETKLKKTARDNTGEVVQSREDAFQESGACAPLHAEVRSPLLSRRAAVGTKGDNGGPKKEHMIPNTIHYFWQGNFEKLIPHYGPMTKTANINPKYTVYLHVLADAESYKTLRNLEYVFNGRIKILNIKEEEWFKVFKKQPRYAQFMASSTVGTGRRPNFASGADIIKSELIYNLGGVWNDVDNTPIKPLPETLFAGEGQILTAGTTKFAKWGGVDGVHSSTFATYKGNPTLKDMNAHSFEKYQEISQTIYTESVETDNPETHFGMISKTAGSYHFSVELTKNEEFKNELTELITTQKKWNENSIIFDQYITPVSTSGAGDIDKKQQDAILAAFDRTPPRNSPLKFRI